MGTWNFALLFGPSCACSLWLYCSDQSGHKRKMFLSLTSIFFVCFFPPSLSRPAFLLVHFVWFSNQKTKKKERNLLRDTRNEVWQRCERRMIVPWGMMKRTLTWDHRFFFFCLFRQFVLVEDVLPCLKQSRKKFDRHRGNEMQGAKERGRKRERENVKWYLGDRIEIEGEYAKQMLIGCQIKQDIFMIQWPWRWVSSNLIYSILCWDWMEAAVTTLLKPVSSVEHQQ